MSTLTIQPPGKTVAFESGANLPATLLAAGEQLMSRCGGNASCGACHLFITEGRKGVSRLAPAKNAKLDTLVGVGSKSRPACQVTLGTEPVTVELLGALSG